jgi:hypothetical protein
MHDTDGDRRCSHSRKSNFDAGRIPRIVRVLAYGLTLLISTSAPADAGDVRTFPIEGVDLTTYRTYRLLPPAETGVSHCSGTVGDHRRPCDEALTTTPGRIEETLDGDPGRRGRGPFVASHQRLAAK